MANEERCGYVYDYLDGKPRPCPYPKGSHNEPAYIHDFVPPAPAAEERTKREQEAQTEQAIHRAVRMVHERMAPWQDEWSERIAALERWTTEADKWMHADHAANLATPPATTPPLKITLRDDDRCSRGHEDCADHPACCETDPCNWCTRWNVMHKGCDSKDRPAPEAAQTETPCAYKGNPFKCRKPLDHYGSCVAMPAPPQSETHCVQDQDCGPGKSVV